MEQNISLTELTVKVIATLKRNFFLFVGIILAFAVLGVAYSYIKKPVFKSKFIAYSPIIKNESAPYVFEPLNVYLTDGQIDEIARQLSIPVETASEIIRIDVYKSKDINERKVIPMGMPLFEENYFTVEILTKSTVDFESIQNGLKAYMDASPFVKQKIQLLKESYSRKIETLDEHIKQLTLIQEGVIKTITKEQKNSGVNVIATDAAYPEGLIELLDSRENAAIARARTEGMILLQPAPNPSKPESKKLIYLLVAVVTGIVVSFFTVFIKEILRKT